MIPAVLEPSDAAPNSPECERDAVTRTEPLTGFEVRNASLAEIGRESWNELALRSVTSTIFQTWDWCVAWVESFPEAGEPWIIAVEAEGELVGLAPFAVARGRRRSMLKWLGDGHADYSDILTGDRSGLVPAAVLSHLRRSACWSAASLRNTTEGGVLSQFVRDNPHSLGFHPLVAAQHPCPALRLRRDPEFTREVRRKKSLKQYHQWFRRQASYRIQHLREADAILAWLDPFFEQHIARRAETPYPSLFLDPAQRAYYRRMTSELASRGEVLFSVLEFEGKPLAFHFGFVRDGVLTYYKPAYDPAWSNRSPGSVLMKELFDFADESRLDKFDFSVGDEAYKSRFSNDLRHNVDLELYRSRATWLGVRAFRSLKDHIKRMPIVRKLRGR